MATLRPSYMRLLLFLTLALHFSAAIAALSCEQLANIAFSTQKFRDQGYPLSTLLAEANKLEATEKLTATELENLRNVVEQAYNAGSRGPLEMLKTCKEKERLGK